MSSLTCIRLLVRSGEPLPKDLFRRTLMSRLSESHNDIDHVRREENRCCDFINHQKSLPLPFFLGIHPARYIAPHKKMFHLFMKRALLTSPFRFLFRQFLGIFGILEIYGPRGDGPSRGAFLAFFASEAFLASEVFCSPRLTPWRLPDCHLILDCDWQGLLRDAWILDDETPESLSHRRRQKEKYK